MLGTDHEPLRRHGKYPIGGPIAILLACVYAKIEAQNFNGQAKYFKLMDITSVMALARERGGGTEPDSETGGP
jgi:hypothetical protein